MKTLIFDLDGTLVQLAPTVVCFADRHELTALREQYNFALVSGSSKVEVEWALTETALRPLFDDRYIVTIEDTNSEKASGRPFQEIQERLDGAMVMIGDSSNDEQGTRIAGIPFVKIQSQKTPNEQRNELARAIRAAILLFKKAKRKQEV